MCRLGVVLLRGGGGRIGRATPSAITIGLLIQETVSSRNGGGARLGAAYWAGVVRTWLSTRAPPVSSSARASWLGRPVLGRLSVVLESLLQSS